MFFRPILLPIPHHFIPIIMTTTRREFLTGGMLGSAALALVPLSACATSPQPQTSSIGPRTKLGISTYSYWHFRPPKTTIETVIEKAAALGVEGVDILHRQMDSEENSYLQGLKRHAFLHGVDLISLSIHQDFVDPDPEVRQKHINHTLHCIELAYEMGIPCIRLNSGRWGTIKSFDDLMAARGEEPVLEGYTEDEGFDWCIESIGKCMDKAQECGVILALENHWGLSRTPEGMLRIAEAINSPWLGLLMDTGNFLEDPYDRLEQIAAQTVFVQAKTYYGGGEWYTLDLDYPRIAGILKNVKYKGYVSLEFEGKAPADEGVQQSIEMLRSAFG